MFKRYLTLTGASWMVILTGFCLPLIVWFLFRKAHRYAPVRAMLRHPRVISIVLLAIAVGLGVQQALAKAAVFDDAFISFRYARNFALGHGLVYNLNERVEGYTNFLWTALIGIIYRLTGCEPPEVGLILSIVAFVFNFLVIYILGHALFQKRNSGIYIPFTAIIMAANPVITDYGTTGLETGAVSLLVNLGVYLLLFAKTNRGVFAAGSAFCLAFFTRPDHAIFYAVGGLTLLAPTLRFDRSNPGATAKKRISKLGVFAAPSLAYIVYLIIKFQYYGSLLPNTYYAKSAGDVYFYQGFVYAWTFLLGTHFWLVIPLLISAFFFPAPDSVTRQLRLFTAVSIVLFSFYVVKIGGDFMYGRFFVTLIPLALLYIEHWMYLLLAAKSGSTLNQWTVPLTAAVLFATAFGVNIIGDTSKRWNVANESTFYRVSQLFPIRMYDINQRFGRFLNTELKQKGLEPVISTGAIGVVGYYSQLELVDFRGLTDRYVASRPLKRRGTPGHEKEAPFEYLQARKVVFARINAVLPTQYAHLTTLGFDDMTLGGRWRIITYDRQLMRQIALQCPEIHFVDFEKYLDGYIQTLDKKNKPEIASDLAWFEQYYFNHNSDPERYARIRAYLQ